MNRKQLLEIGKSQADKWYTAYESTLRGQQMIQKKDQLVDAAISQSNTK